MKAIFVTLTGSIEGNIETMDLSHLKLKGYVKQRFDPTLNCMIPRKELAGKPIFEGWYGPMWDGDRIRYESPNAYEAFSQ